MRATLSLGRLFDIRVGVHVSWFVIYGVVTLSIAETVRGVAPLLAWMFAAICGLLLFTSVLFHEFAHALVARRFGVRTRAITLFLFGGVATLEREPSSPRADVLIALAGPAMSAVIAALAFGVLVALQAVLHGSLATVIARLTAYLAFANGVLAIFNLIPAFPLDGGRVLRAALWQLRKSRAAASGAASIVGLVLASGLMLAGVILALRLHVWQDAWYVVIGAFLLRASWLQLWDSRLIERLERVRVGDLMEAAQTGDQLFEDFSLASSATALDAVGAFRTSARTQIAVVDGGRLAGWLHRERTLAIIERAA
jgi:Zn-dependent protease